MKYTVSVMYQDGNSLKWEVNDRSTAMYILVKEMNRYGKLIKKAFLKGVYV